MTIFTSRDLREIQQGLKDTHTALNRTAMSLKRFTVSTTNGEMVRGSTPSHTVTLAGIRQITSESQQNWLRTALGVNDLAHFTILFLTTELTAAFSAASLSPVSIERGDILTFGDVSGAEFEPLTPLVDFHPWGDNELQRAVFVRRRAYKQ